MIFMIARTLTADNPAFSPLKASPVLAGMATVSGFRYGNLILVCQFIAWLMAP
jgi:hypothetical protein